MSELREALKPCPFCGGAAEAYDRFNVRCTGCGAEINAQPGHAAGLWNCRQSPAPVVEQSRPVSGEREINEMVNRFLSWTLPKDFAPDCGIGFTPVNHPNSWPIGTNLFTAEQARAMVMHMLSGITQSPAPAVEGEAETPRTDAVLQRYGATHEWAELIAHAKQLECERNFYERLAKYIEQCHQQALSELSQAKRELQSRCTSGEWVRVKDRLPPPHENVWCYNADGRQFEGCVCYGMHEPFFTYPRGDGSASNTAPAWINVTHWRELPAAPKGE